MKQKREGATKKNTVSDKPIRDRIIAAMEQVFGADQRRIEHARAVLSHAEAIHAAEGGDALVVQAAAILHDIGMHEAERKHKSTAGRYQELEGPPIARRILENIGLAPERIDHVCRIVGSHHSAKDIDTLEFQIIWDADWLVNIPASYPGIENSDLIHRIGRTFRTNKGRELARGLLKPE